MKKKFYILIFTSMVAFSTNTYSIQIGLNVNIHPMVELIGLKHWIADASDDNSNYSWGFGIYTPLDSCLVLQCICNYTTLATDPDWRDGVPAYKLGSRNFYSIFLNLKYSGLHRSMKNKINPYFIAGVGYFKINADHIKYIEYNYLPVKGSGISFSSFIASAGLGLDFIIHDKADLFTECMFNLPIQSYEKIYYFIWKIGISYLIEF